MQITQEQINLKEMFFLSLELYEVQLRKEVISDLRKNNQEGLDNIFSKVLRQLIEREKELIKTIYQFKVSYFESVWLDKLTKFVA